MRWHVALRVIGSALLVSAVTAVSLQVHVGGAGASGRSCGSSLDVITDRSGWEVWYAQDAADRPAAPADRLLRTIRCPAAVNARSVAAGVLAGAGVGVLVAATAVRRRSEPPAPPRGELAARLHRLGSVVTILGAVLVVAGLAALAVVLANREAALFIYVRRSLVAAIGTVVLAPVVALVAGGRALTLIARALDRPESGDETG
jgi:hypothetical protein